jgi:hypothetical protein
MNIFLAQAETHKNIVANNYCRTNTLVMKLSEHTGHIFSSLNMRGKRQERQCKLVVGVRNIFQLWRFSGESAQLSFWLRYFKGSKASESETGEELWCRLCYERKGKFRRGFVACHNFYITFVMLHWNVLLFDIDIKAKFYVNVGRAAN